MAKNKETTKQKYLKYLKLWFVVGIIMISLIVPTINYVKSTCKIDGYLAEHSYCSGPETFGQALSDIGTVGSHFDNSKVFSPLMFAYQVAIWPIVLITSILV